MQNKNIKKNADHAVQAVGIESEAFVSLIVVFDCFLNIIPTIFVGIIESI